MKFLVVAVLLVCTGLNSTDSTAYANAPPPDDPELGTCEQITSELGNYKDTFTSWGPTKEGGSHYNSQSRSAAGEPYSIGATIFKSKSSFKTSVKGLHAMDLSSNTPLLNNKGEQVGERLVREQKLNAQVTTVYIWRITDRMIQGISAPSLKLALSVEKTEFFCREELERRQNKPKIPLPLGGVRGGA